ncbi:MAG: hypothetical protein QOI74_3074, partial [Micromonosporaceae bacterium]|nr:hypothetical protein [Micromonosporaceae bacterium]
TGQDVTGPESADPVPDGTVDVAPAVDRDSLRPVADAPAAGSRSRRGPLVRVGLVLVAASTLLGGPAAVAVDRQFWQPAGRSALTVNAPAASAAENPGGSDERRSAPSRATREGDVGALRPTSVRARLQSVLSLQAAALLRGDETGFLAPADPGNAALMGDLRRRFAVLRALAVTGWSETLDGDPTPVDGGWQASVHIGYCFVVADCHPVPVEVDTRWLDGGESPIMVEFGSSGAAGLGPRPWEVSELTVAVGPRTIVAAPPGYADRVPDLLRAAENAAAVDDRYARWAPPPGRYVVYLAGPDEWGHWYGVHQAEWVAGFAMPITDQDTEIVLNGQRLVGSQVEDTLRHEFAHVVTLAGVHRDYTHQWWFVEGIAEYVRMAGRPLRDYELLATARRYVRAGHDTELSGLAEPPAAISTEDASGRYGVAFLTVRRLAERYGEDRMLRFFDEVVRRGVPPDQASTSDFGADWGEVARDCARYARRNLS